VAAPPRGFTLVFGKNSHDAGPLWKFETGDSKLEIQNWRLDTALSFPFQVSSFAFPLTPKGREGGWKKKNFTANPVTY
jgi:hypothetical protein